MPSFSGRDVLLAISDGETPPSYLTIGAARTTEMEIVNQAAAMTRMDDDGVARYVADGGVQGMRLVLRGLFKDSAGEERLRVAAFDRMAVNCRLTFGNGDEYTADFVVESYQRLGSYDGFEAFAVTLLRSSAGTFTPAS